MPFCCTDCGAVDVEPQSTCDACGGFIRYTEADEQALHRAVSDDATTALPAFESAVSMGEGETPLVSLDGLDVEPTVYGKLESLNPTCSFKDRGSALLVSAIADPTTSWEAVAVASTGNTAPSVAAYAARAGIPCAVVVPSDTSFSKIAQVAAHGVDIYTVEGTFSDCFRTVQAASDERLLNGTAVYSANPFVASANRTVAFEIVAQLGFAPDWVAVPVGAGPLLGGTHFGFTELFAAGIIETLPRMLCVQAEGCHPVVDAFDSGEAVEAWASPITTSVGAIADPLKGYAEDGEATRQAVLNSDGSAVALADDHIHTWTDRLARVEGIYAEPASAASVAAVETDPVDGSVVSLITGHGLKEPAEHEPETLAIDDDPEGLRTKILKLS